MPALFLALLQRCASVSMQKSSTLRPEVGKRAKKDQNQEDGDGHLYPTNWVFPGDFAGVPVDGHLIDLRPVYSYDSSQTGSKRCL